MLSVTVAAGSWISFVKLNLIQYLKRHRYHRICFQCQWLNTYNCITLVLTDEKGLLFLIFQKHDLIKLVHSDERGCFRSLSTGRKIKSDGIIKEIINYVVTEHYFSIHHILLMLIMMILVMMMMLTKPTTKIT